MYEKDGPIVAQMQNNFVNKFLSGSTATQSSLVINATETWDLAAEIDEYDKEFWMKYDYKGAIFFVFGLLFIYISAILILVIAMIRRSRTELFLMDQLHDLEELRKKNRTPSKKRSSRWKLSSLTDKLSRKSSSTEESTLDNHPINQLVETRIKLSKVQFKEEFNA